MKTILDHIEWWKEQLANMSQPEVGDCDQGSLEQMRVWGPARRAFVECASAHEAISSKAARFIDQKMKSWDRTALSTRLGVDSFVRDVFRRTVQRDIADADKILGDLAVKIASTPSLRLSADGAFVAAVRRFQ